MQDYFSYFRAQSRSQPSCEIVHLGRLYLPSGKIICSDPFRTSEVSFLRQTVRAGNYDVNLCLVTLADWGRRVALASLTFEDREPAQWLIADYVVGGEVFTTFQVESGLACFMDLQTAELFEMVVAEYYRVNAEGNYYDDVLAAEFSRHVPAGWSRKSGDWDLHHPLRNDSRNIAIFASGLGDGAYSAFWGITRDGQPAMLVVDFQLL